MSAGGERAGRERAPAVEVTGVTRRFGDFVALDRVSLTIGDGELFSLLGPSGCGKTTLLRILAGLDLPDEGTVRIGGADMSEVPAHLRPVNTVFQSYALFPHLSVRDNVALGLRMKRVPAAELATRVDEALAMARLEGFASRKPSQLSGGQRQRVALARALVNRPQVLLLDEPLGALDSKLRKELQVELLEIQRQVGITFVFVTHDQEEALVLSDRIAVMRAGKIEQLGEAEELYERPRNRFVSQFLGTCNLIEAGYEAEAGAEIRVGTALGTLFLAREAWGEGRADRRDAGGRCTLAIRPEKVALISPIETGVNKAPATVREIVYIGAESHYLLDTAAGTVVAYVMNSLLAPHGLAIGDRVTIYLPSSALFVLED
jgi:spermidine/putrescine transport system ATP-binding protein